MMGAGEPAEAPSPGGAPARWARQALEALAAALMGGIALLVLANALGRYLFGKPLPWSEELVITAMIWVASTGLLLGAIRGSLITCDVLVARLPPRACRLLAVACGVIGAGALGFFAWQIRAYLGLFGGDVTPILRMPKGLGISALMLAMAGMGGVLLFRAARLMARGARP
ncbi:TRAP transporter small permease [Vannielia litorea]|uniref:TRAP transporter small permease protein n=1 Tax=Vannielia litorea TaxID=1217970 RepID=A0A1N6EML8_9RHOB|nr:TRAP transporter small permease [Vannielia litorea]SIN84284.1 TRAP-type C4-dicarboxylate transport system, small permease component [Vannielia litorea]